MTKQRTTAYLLLLVVSIIWGVAGPVIKFTLASFPPLIFLTYRFFISTLIAAAYFAAAKPKLPKTSKELSYVLLYSLLSVSFGLGLLFLGFDRTSSLLGSLLSSTGPILAVVAGALLLKEIVTPFEKIGTAIALMGTLITTVGPAIITNGSTSIGSLEGNIMIMAAVAIDVFGAILAKLIVQGRIAPATLTHISFVIGLLTIGPLMIVNYPLQQIVKTFVGAPISAHMGVWFMALASGTLAYTFKNRALRWVETGEASLFAYLMPVWAAPLAVFWLGEKITPPFIIGAILIAGGVTLAEYRRHKIRRKRRHQLRRLHKKGKK